MLAITIYTLLYIKKSVDLRAFCPAPFISGMVMRWVGHMAWHDMVLGTLKRYGMAWDGWVSGCPWYLMWDFEEEVAANAACSTFSSTLTSHGGLAYRWCFMIMMRRILMIKILFWVWWFFE